MKKAREIVIPEERPLTLDEFEDFKSHALNSSLWYGSAYTRSEKQIVEKLQRKGYTTEPVQFINENGELESFDIISHVLERLRESLVVDDEAYARGLIARYSSAKRGESYTRRKLLEKGISQELADELMEELRDDEGTIEAIAALAELYRNSSSYLREQNSYRREQKLTGHLLARGYSFDDISLWRNAEEE